jgi:ribulose-5-phosphate 4-epimerase/fuculose-1-phosphate aldolase
VLGPHMAVSLKSHGLLMACATIEEAIVFTVMLEEACRIQLLMEAAGGAAPEFPAEDVAKLRDAQASPAMVNANFAYLGRLATGGRLPHSLATLPA